MEKNRPVLFLRADAGVKSGAGHVMRLMAVAEAWNDAGGESFLITRELPENLKSRLSNAGIRVLPLEGEAANDASGTLQCVSAISASQPWIAVDGYHFEKDYIPQLRRGNARVLQVDDGGENGPYSADVVLNPNGQANAEAYKNREPHTELLLGASHTLLRKEFIDQNSGCRTFPQTARKFLVTLGGSDPENATLYVLKALNEAVRGQTDCEARILLGPLNPHYDTIRQWLEQEALFSFELLRGTTEMPALLHWADIAITAGGVTLQEMEFFGVPAIVLSIAGNQDAGAVFAGKNELAIYAGRWKDTPMETLARLIRDLAKDAKQREILSTRARKLIDGKGASRVVDALLRKSGTVSS